jgi:hypothetical protein
MKVKYNFILMLLLDQRLCFGIEVSFIGVGGGKMLCASWVQFPPREIVSLGYAIGQQQVPSGRKSYTLVP